MQAFCLRAPGFKAQAYIVRAKSIEDAQRQLIASFTGNAVALHVSAQMIERGLAIDLDALTEASFK